MQLGDFNNIILVEISNQQALLESLMQSEFAEGRVTSELLLEEALRRKISPSYSS